MIETFIKAWDSNKDKLKEYFKSHTMGDYYEYKEIINLLFNIVINPFMVEHGFKVFDLSKLTEVDNGSYQGTLLYLIPDDDYQPSAWNYIITCVDYGSCSGCDLLQSIHFYDHDKVPNEKQVQQYMTLCLHIIQRCKYPYDINTYIPD